MVDLTVEGTGLSARAIAALMSRGERLTLVHDDVLVCEGELSDTVYLVIEGEFVTAIRAPGSSPTGTIDVGRSLPGQLIGEVAALVGAPRSATIRASGDAVVLAVESAKFVSWLDEEPDAAERIVAVARQRLRNVQVAAMAVELFGEGARPLIPQMLESAEWVELEAGATLFEQGDVPDAAYFVLSGRLQVSRRNDDDYGEEQPIILGDIGRAEVVGESAVIQRLPRSATVKALRDTTLARFSVEDFESLLASNPALMLNVVRRIVSRVTGHAQDRASARSVALIVTADIDPNMTANLMLEEIDRHGTCQQLTSAGVDASLRRIGVAQTHTTALDDARLNQYIYELETTHEHLLYVTDSAPTAWSRRAIQRADCLLVVSSPRPGADEQRRIGEFLALCTNAQAQRWLVLLEHATATDPTPSRESAISSQFDEVHHVRRDNATDLARLSRLAIGAGLGLVLGGGGARGFAHLGVLRALEELGVAVDKVGGASMGAIFAAAVGLHRPSNELVVLCTEQFDRLFDYTVPVVALLKAKRITTNLHKVLGDRDVEDLWIPFYCVSTNLTRSRLEVHRTGELVLALRASIAIPGVLPPVPVGDELLIDGGVLNNMPADIMRADRSISTVIAVDVAPKYGPGTSEDYGPYLSGWQALRRFARRRTTPYPGVASVLVRSMITSSEGKRARMRTDGTVDLYLDLDMPGVGLLDFNKIRPAVERGYQVSKPLISEWLETRSVSP